ncbi:DNA double-strand break repair nuclease NurA [Methanocella conradii]|uniref:DNA double-strand break repair nuclease NurA n=1 Tax=Methanocella conradii TaxID=1175444 RepID=UPI0024B39D71|nr:DNA double-strand break repair nuclease NurA [Methanocella conradii]MDI6898179.1 DNA double-strand break repair nuclease NurA [Methanocella conradii]
MLSQMTEDPFQDLPESLVEEMLSECEELSNNLFESFKKLNDNKNIIRNILIDNKILKNYSEIFSSFLYPTTCGVDGSYAIEKLISTDIAACAAVAVEGLTPPKEKRYWEKPYHYSIVKSIRHSNSTNVVIRAIMICMELELAVKAPHDVIFLDGSLTTPFIYLNQAFNKKTEVPEVLSKLLDEWAYKGINAYNNILNSTRTDKIFVGVPKYTTKREISEIISGNKNLNNINCEDRGLLSFILNPGEFIGPLDIQKPGDIWHFDKPQENLEKIINDIKVGLNNLNIVYYRPFDFIPAIRMEISPSVASNKQRLAMLIESINIQCGVPGIMEPYPLYLADRMVKHLGTALPAIRKTTTQEMAFKWEDNLGNIYFAMHGYRTEQG